MRNPSNTSKGILFFLFALLFLCFAWYIFEGLASFLPETFLEVIFWIGVTVLIFITLIVTPYYYVEGRDVSILSIGKGYLVLCFGYFLSFTINAIAPTFVDMLTITGNTSIDNQVQAMMWLMFLIVHIAFMVALPTFYAFKGLNDSAS